MIRTNTGRANGAPLLSPGHSPWEDAAPTTCSALKGQDPPWHRRQISNGLSLGWVQSTAPGWCPFRAGDFKGAGVPRGVAPG
jgi:hypothetical protein